MPKRKLPQRDPFIGPPAEYSGAPAEVVELFATAIHEWADHSEPPMCRANDSPGIGRATGKGP